MALTFNGTSDYLTLGDVLDFSAGAAMTTMAWIRRSASGVRHEIISKEEANGSGWELSIDSTNNAEFGDFNGGWPVVRSTTTIATNTLYHICGVYDPAAVSLRIYVNGVQEATAFTGGTGLANSSSLNIGRSALGSRYFNGSIEDVRVYNRVLSAGEVAAICVARGRDHILEGLVGRWLMTEEAPGNGGTATVNVQSTASTVNGSTLTLAYTVPSTASNPVLVVAASADSTTIGNVVVSSVTFGAASMTLRAAVNTTTVTGDSSNVFTLGVNPGDSATITVTYVGTTAGRNLIAFTVTNALDSIDTSGTNFSDSGNATASMTTSATKTLGIAHHMSGDNFASTSTSGSGLTQLVEILSGNTTFGSRVGTFAAATAQAYSGYGFNFGSAIIRSSISMIALNTLGITSVPDLSNSRFDAVIAGGPNYAANIAVDAVG
jgi:hypothetical protein